MLIFLGVFFLFTTVKDTLSPIEGNTAITKLQEGTSSFLTQEPNFGSFPSQKEVIETMTAGGFLDGIGESSLTKVKEGLQ